MKKTLLYIFAALLIVILAAGCAPAEDAAPEETPVAQRIVSLMPSNTEILFALGLEDSIVGVTEFCNYPPQLETAVNEGRIKRVGDAFNINEELIVSLQPTLVLIGFDNDASRALEERLNNLEIPTAVIVPASLQQTLDSIIQLGTLTDREEHAEQLVAEMETTIADITALTEGLEDEEKPRVLMLLDLDSLFVAGSGTLEDELITLAGAVNISGVEGYGAISEETVVQSAPDIIISTFPFRDRILAEKEAWQEIPAVAAGTVYDLDGDLINRPAPRLMEGLKLLLETIHPDL